MMNVAQSVDRAVAMGWIIGFGNIGGIPVAYLFEETKLRITLVALPSA